MIFQAARRGGRETDPHWIALSSLFQMLVERGRCWEEVNRGTTDHINCMMGPGKKQHTLFSFVNGMWDWVMLVSSLAREELRLIGTAKLSLREMREKKNSSIYIFHAGTKKVN